MAPRDAVPLEETVLDFVRKSEEAVLEVGRKWADAVAEFVPVEMPLVRDLRKQVFDMIEDLLRVQHRVRPEDAGRDTQGGDGQHQACTDARTSETSPQGRLSPGPSPASLNRRSRR